MNSTAEQRILGEYRLKELLSENDVSRTWLAEQISVSRFVMLDELRTEKEDIQERFIADVRAKAGVDHPLVASVYEAVCEQDLFFYAHELLSGATLEDRRKASAPFKPIDLTRMLHRISELNMQFESFGQSTSPFGLENIHLDDQGVLRLDNLAIAGPRGPEESFRDIVSLGQSMKSLVADSQPGSSRVFTLLGWMRGEQIENSLTWVQIKDVCEQIERQLEDVSSFSYSKKLHIRHVKKSLITIVLVISLVVVAAILIIFFRIKKPTLALPPKVNLRNVIIVPSGKMPTPDGTEQVIHSFQITVQEVTIREYGDFLETLETLSSNRRQRTFDHVDQPPGKSSHEPDDWSLLFAAAKSGQTWKGLPVSLDSPVVGVDWWDCAAYAEWKQARLPTQEEWFAALRTDLSKPESIKPASWIQMTDETSDITPTGLIGMAGSVCEWTRGQGANPANPLGERKWIIIGGSYLKPGSNALTREWTNDRLLRRPDLGFRIVFDVK